MISLFLWRTRVHPPTTHYHQDLSHYNLYLCSQMEDSVQELASCVCNYTQVRGCRAECLGFEARKEGREEWRRRGGIKRARRERKTHWSSRKSGYFTHGCFVNGRCVHVCVCRGVYVCVFQGGGGSAGKGCVYPICSLPLPCGWKNHWPALSLIPEDVEAERQTPEREVGHRGWPRTCLMDAGARMCSLKEPAA